jgi:hypothetical protein
MGGRPKAHTTDGEFEIGHFRLNLDSNQLDEVARILALPDNDKSKLSLPEGTQQPSDGQKVKLTFKGRSVTLTYQRGKAVNIAPEG